MSDRRPTPVESGDDEPTPPRGTSIGRRDTDDDRDERSDDEWDEEWEPPNYLVRRALVVGAVVAGIALAAIGASRLIGGGDSSATKTSAEWDTLVVLTADEIQLLDGSSGDVITSYPAPDDLLDAQSVIADNVLVTMTDEGRIAQIDLATGTTRRGNAALDETLRLSDTNAQIAIAGSDTGGDVTIIDTRERNVLSTAEVTGLDDPLIFAGDVLVNRAGSHVAIPVPSAFQSFVIDLATETSKALAGRVIALDDEHVVTEQPAGERSEIEFYDLTGERLGSVDVGAPRASLLRDDGSMLVVTRDGTVSTVSADGAVSDAEPLVDPDGLPIEITGGTVTANGERLLATGASRVFVLDADGAQVAAFGDGIVVPATRAAQCIVVGAGTSASPSSLIDLESGTVVTAIERGIVTASSIDGCTNAIIGAASPRLVSPGRTIDIDANSIAAVAPDGSSIVTVNGRRLELVGLGDADDDTVEVVAEVGDRQGVVRFGTR